MIYDASPETEEALTKAPISAYIGFDPTASSLHVGSLLPIMLLARLQAFGHRPIAIVGGGTGRIGDPSGKTAERKLLDDAQVAENIEGIRAQLSHFLRFDDSEAGALIVNNNEWLGSLTLIDFLRDVGKHFTVNYMMGKESVKRRLEGSDGISYTEFTYMMLQAYDYLEMFDRYDCTLQMGGSDQWGNITAGTDLIRRMRGGKAHALVSPLVTTSSGVKFGKTEAGTIWLDPDRTSPYRFYQFWLNAEDADAITYLKFFTWRTKDEIDAIAEEMEASPEKRHAQRVLAQDVTRMVHGETAVERAEQAASVLFSGEVSRLSVSEVEDILDDVPSATIEATEIADEGIGLLDLLRAAGLAASNGEARRLVQGGGIRVNGQQEKEPGRVVALHEAMEGRLFVLRKGKKQYALVRIA